jgi:two-component system, OmpR family, sensor kinase
VTLRRRLMLALSSLAVLLLAVTAVSTALIRNELFRRLEEPLRRELPAFAGAPLLAGFDPCRFASIDGNSILVVASTDAVRAEPCEGQPILQVDFEKLDLRPSQVSSIFTASDTAGDQYRVRVFRSASGTYLGVGLALDRTFRTIRTILAIQLGAVAVCLAGISVLANWAARHGLQSLGRIGMAATAITSGKRDTRVQLSPRDPAEVHSVGRALNEMLDESDRSFSTVATALAEREHSEDRLRQFVSDASHELKTPLTSIQGYSELLINGVIKEPEAVIDTSRRINSEASRMNRLVQDLLQLSKLDTEPQLDFSLVRVDEAVQAAVSDAVAADPRWPIEIERLDEIPVQADRDALHQVLTNLLGNVRQHTPVGTPTVISTSIRGATCSIRIADSGPGIPPDLRASVFERFVRADASRSRQTGGAGLGLSIVRSLVLAHRGSVDVAANAPTGTVFTITLPLDN